MWHGIPTAFSQKRTLFCSTETCGQVEVLIVYPETCRYGATFTHTIFLVTGIVTGRVKNINSLIEERNNQSCPVVASEGCVGIGHSRCCAWY
ncbi:MAG: hypothetical protein CM1200mP3_16330 [Chloroflexota bacterium]|nr:MAG: hypothetical protein CM1200mP3_16330 [Chloroflexota bacterium]